MIFIYIIFLISNEIKNIFCQNLNIFQNIISQYTSSKNYESSLIIFDEIQKIFNTKNESFSIPIYISIIDLTHINILNISNDRDTYLNNYNNLLGVSDRVIYDKKKKMKENKLIKVFLNGTVMIKNNSELEEMIIKKIIFEKKDYNIELYFLKNRYMSQYQTINEDNRKLLKFYDLNIIFYKDCKNLYKDIEKNDFVILEKIENDLNENDITILVNNYINNFINDLIPLKIQNKINIWMEIKNIFNNMLKLEHCKINLHNFLLFYEIKQVKEKIENIEKNLIILLINSIKLLYIKLIIFYLKNFLERYNVSQNDSKIDFYFYIISLIAIALVVFLLYKIYQEFIKAFYKKIK